MPKPEIGYRIPSNSPKSSLSNARAYALALIDLLAFEFVLVVTILAGIAAAKKYGAWTGVGAGILAAVASVSVVVQFYRWSWRRDRRRLDELRDKYRSIYRVLDLPANPAKVKKPDGAEIRVGDYGWEAGPIKKDGLIYLHGLTLEWTVVWYAGFQPDQVERVGAKPISQYDYWIPSWAEPRPLPPCPFPILERQTPTVGLPHHSNKFIEIPSAYPKKPLRR